jgi:hypothetical protein
MTSGVGTSHLSGEALVTLAKWKEPKAAKLVVAEIGKSVSLEQACSLLESIGDRSVAPALKKLLKALPPKDKGSRDRLEQCIAMLAGA